MNPTLAPLAPLTDAHLTLWASDPNVVVGYARNGDALTFNTSTRDRWGNSGTRRDRVERLLAWQGGVCVKCGDALDLEDAELSHHIAATAHGEPNRTHAGVFYGNVSVWHGLRCNRPWGDRNVQIADLARPDLVFTGTTDMLPKV